MNRYLGNGTARIPCQSVTAKSLATFEGDLSGDLCVRDLCGTGTFRNCLIKVPVPSDA
jgi:hypothetical protein